MSAQNVSFILEWNLASKLFFRTGHNEKTHENLMSNGQEYDYVSTEAKMEEKGGEIRGYNRI